jgi:hypothetical protein
MKIKVKHLKFKLSKQQIDHIIEKNFEDYVRRHEIFAVLRLDKSSFDSDQYLKFYIEKNRYAMALNGISAEEIAKCEPLFEVDIREEYQEHRSNWPLSSEQAMGIVAALRKLADELQEQEEECIQMENS